MPTEVILPRVDMDMTEGRVSRWFVEEGATVTKGQPLFEMETDKAAMEIEAPAAGTIRDLSAKLDTPLPVGSPVAWIYAEGETIESAKRRPASPRERGESLSSGADPRIEQAARPRSEGEGPGKVAPAQEPPRLGPIPANGEGEPGARATPLARRLAREQGLDIAAIAGSGPRGRVQAGDVEASALTSPRSRGESLSSGADPRIEQAARPRSEGEGLGEFAPAPKPNHPAPHPSPLPADGERELAPLHAQWLRQGRGTPLVLIHGFGASLDAWRLFVATLRPECPVLAIDLPGHGGSAERRVASFDAMVEAAATTLRAERLGATHLSGHSLGGAVAAALAARQDVVARSLFLLAPAGLGPDIDGAFLEGLLRAGSKASLAPWIARLGHDPTALGPAFVEATLRQLSAEGAREGLRHVAATLFPDGTQAFGVRPAFDRLVIPAKVVWGIDDRIIPHRHADGLPGPVAVHRFAGVGHMPQFEVREEVARLQRETMGAAADG